ncbi:methyltransferase domain-containing protein [Pseudofrankia sp. DC12]|uniref:class I SAM-dependent methyltransferase n=1 Tax=Pseudofrankia sp. DC12 TaxID=683315 RepID=UPI0005F866DB|nr:methyltransferase domain-containing protein [Pseudofrankia sp. DC12]
MATPSARLDGLADSYERTRPRYPVELFSHAVSLLPADARPTVVDAGAGTGIALEALLPLLPAGADVHAVDVSGEMVELGRVKFPEVSWTKGNAEQHLATFSGVDLVTAAQSYQWMDRPAFRAAAAGALRPGGICLVIQNNRDLRAGGLAGDYEDLVAELSPFHSHGFRPIDVEGELASTFDEVTHGEQAWLQPLTIDEFVTMSSSSAQAQRAIAAVGSLFLHRVRALAARHEKDGHVHVPYITEAFYGKAHA